VAVLFWLDIFKIGSWELFAWVILLISASWVARIAD
jgi:hypothetical protein